MAGQHGAARIESAADIDLDVVPPSVRIDLPDRADGVERRGIVGEKIDGAEITFHRRKSRRQSIRIENIDAISLGLTTLRGNLLGSSFNVGPSGQQRDAAAGTGLLTRYAAADASTRTGDHAHLTIEFQGTTLCFRLLRKPVTRREREFRLLMDKRLSRERH